MDDFTWEQQQNYEQGGESDKEQKRAKDGWSLLPWFTQIFPFDFFYEWGS